MPFFSNDQIIEALYGSILNREPDPDGRKNYDARLQAGATLEELISEFVGCDEFNEIRSAKSPVDYAAVGLKDATRAGWYSAKTAELCPGFAITATDMVADIGCGDGGNSIFCARHASMVIAVDINPQSVATTERRLQAEPNTRYSALLSDGNTLPIEARTIDKIICTEVLEHVDSPNEFMSELVRIGKPGSMYLLTVPDALSEQVLKRVAAPSAYQKPNHVRVLSREDFEALVLGAGLQILDHRYRSFYWAVWTALAWKCGGLNGKHPVLDHWATAWAELLQSPGGQACKEALDLAMPKSQAIIARKTPYPISEIDK
jgi:2-polyprenyl-3-methyl-5-hydroxy-6-metoxy-1,4-benzoquinol methylase